MAVSLIFTGYYRHPKFLAANGISGGELSEVLWCRGLDYVNEQGTDGFIPMGMPQILTPLKTGVRIRGLVGAGLWVPVEGGWRYHDFLEWNRTASSLNAAKKAKSEVKSRAGRLGAEARWGGRLPKADNGSANGTGMAEGMARE